jgi:hypothetical protein
MVSTPVIPLFSPSKAATVHFVNISPNIGRPLFDCSREASVLDSKNVRCDPVQGGPKPENRPCTITKSPSATIVPHLRGIWEFPSLC